MNNLYIPQYMLYGMILPHLQNVQQTTKPFVVMRHKLSLYFWHFVKNTKKIFGGFSPNRDERVSRIMFGPFGF